MSKIKAVLFDLDGTLLPLDQDAFTKAYLGGLVAAAIAAGYDKYAVSTGIMAGVSAMLDNKSGLTNEEVFWLTLKEKVGEDIAENRYLFDSFYESDFQKIKSLSWENSKSADLLAAARERGLYVALATNPVFPSVATESRIRWAGLDPDDFDLVTTYENSHYCKPTHDYYREVAHSLGVLPEECLMVGNDISDDMPAGEIGMYVFLLTDCLINRKNEDISKYPSGGFDDLINYLKKI